MSLTIPVVPPPKDDETLTSWISRIAAANMMPLAWVTKIAGWTQSTHHTDTPRGYGLILSQEHAEGLARATGTPIDRLAQMVPTTWIGSLARGTDPSGRDISTDTQGFAKNNWLYTHGSHYCPECLREDDGAWQLAWKAPFTFACSRHKRLLLTICPACERRPDSGRTDGLKRPAFPKSIPQPGLCHNPRKQEAKMSRSPCLHDHTQDQPGPELPEKFFTAQQSLRDWNRPFEYWNDLRALTAYTITVHTLEDIEHILGAPLPVDLRATWEEQHNSRQQRLANNRALAAEGKDWRHGTQDTTGRKPPTDTRLLATALTAAHSAHESDAILREFIDRGHSRDAVHWTPASRLTNLNASNLLIERATHAHLGEAVTLLEAGLHSRYRTATSQDIQWNPEHLPGYLWPDLYEQHLAHHFADLPLKQSVARKFAIVALYRLAKGVTWTEASGRFADGLIKNKKLHQNVLYTLRNSPTGDRHLPALLSIAEVAKELPAERVEQTRLDREWANKAFRTPLPPKACEEALPPRYSATETRRVNAAVWLWTHYTLGDRIDAPAWPSKPTRNNLQVYSLWLRNLGPKMITALIEWAESTRRE